MIRAAVGAARVFVTDVASFGGYVAGAKRRGFAPQLPGIHHLPLSKRDPGTSAEDGVPRGAVDPDEGVKVAYRLAILASLGRPGRPSRHYCTTIVFATASYHA
jgi:hypothetical protein